MTSKAIRAVGLYVMLASMAACASAPPAPAAPTAPRYPEFPAPVVPAELAVPPALRERHEAAWLRLQAGDLRTAAREFSEVLRAMPGFYPAQAGLGFVRLADRQFEEAATRFRAATTANDDYLPGWSGLAEAELGLGRDAEAIEALERVVELDPSRADAKSRLDLLEFRRLPALIEGARRAREAGRLDEARRQLDEALALSPSSAVILRELALVELNAGNLPGALRRAEEAVAADRSDAQAQATLAQVLEAQGNTSGAAAAWERAVAIDPRPEWRARADALKGREALSVIPPEFRAVPTATTVTRAQVAAYIGIRLEGLVARAPQRSTDLATDIRDHWAARWILPVTRAGLMEIYPNHTFQPSAEVRRGDLARIVAQVLAMIPQRQMDLARWRAARPRFSDLPAGNAFYAPAALAVSAGAMSPRSGDTFAPTEPASGPELVAAIDRIEQIAGR
ncbi:MAG: tetratricopeptide repeat protein [Vicinamibacterales bacterium]